MKKQFARGAVFLYFFYFWSRNLEQFSVCVSSPIRRSLIYRLRTHSPNLRAFTSTVQSIDNRITEPQQRGRQQSKMIGKKGKTFATNVQKPLNGELERNNNNCQRWCRGAGPKQRQQLTNKKVQLTLKGYGKLFKRVDQQLSMPTPNPSVLSGDPAVDQRKPQDARNEAPLPPTNPFTRASHFQCLPSTVVYAVNWWCPIKL